MIRSKLIKKNKKGQGAIGIILFFLVLFTILIIGFIAAMVFGVVHYASGEITPIMEDLGMVGESNVSEYAQYSFGTLDTVLNSFGMIIGVAYVLALIGSIIFAASYSYSPSPVFIALYFGLILLLIMGSIIMSNMYENIYSGNDVIADELQDQTILSYMILYSPVILTIMAFITGIYIFAIRSSDGGSGIWKKKDHFQK